MKVQWINDYFKSFRKKSKEKKKGGKNAKKKKEKSRKKTKKKKKVKEIIMPICNFIWIHYSSTRVSKHLKGSSVPRVSDEIYSQEVILKFSCF